MKIKLIQSIVLFIFLVFGFSSSGVASNTNHRAEENRHKVSYLTLRNATGNSTAHNFYGDERDTLNYGECEFLHSASIIPPSFSQNGLVYIPETNIELISVRQGDDRQFLQAFGQTASNGRPLLYLHGYNTSFAKSCEQAALFQANLNLEGRLLLFSWPSDGNLLNYTRDEADIFWSVALLEATLKKMSAHFGVAGFDVVAHSLGARGLFLALVQLANSQQKSLPLINQLVLTAPDIDAGIFAQYLDLIRPLASNITLYVSANDRLLALSREVHGYARLGEAGSHLNGIEGIDIIDISDVGVRSFSGHLYHLYHKRVEKDLKRVINEAQKAGQRDQLMRIGNNRWKMSMDQLAQ